MNQRLTTCPCGTEFSVPIKRGRPQKFCDDCRNKESSVKTKLSSIEVVDRLEQNLRSRGTHISQHVLDGQRCINCKVMAKNGQIKHLSSCPDYVREN